MWCYHRQNSPITDITCRLSLSTRAVICLMYPVMMSSTSNVYNTSLFINLLGLAIPPTTTTTSSSRCFTSREFCSINWSGAQVNWHRRLPGWPVTRTFLVLYICNANISLGFHWVAFRTSHSDLTIMQERSVGFSNLSKLSCKTGKLNKQTI